MGTLAIVTEATLRLRPAPPPKQTMLALFAGTTSVTRATEPMEADWLRQVRRLAFRAMERLGVARMEDVDGAPRSRLPELLAAIERIAAAHDVGCGTFGHAGDGNLHPTFAWERGDGEAEARAQAACEELYRAAISLGGP